MMKEFSGERLKFARQYRGLTVEQLADKINVKKQSVSLYENNKVTPEFDKILFMSKELNFPYDYFMQPPINGIQSKSTYFRALLTTSKKYRTEQIRKLEALAVIYATVSDYVVFPKINLPDLSINDYSPTEAAMELRRFWDLGDGPVKDIITILESNGIIVTTFATSTDQIDAFSHLVHVENNGIYFVGLSSNKESATRKHFDVAHELGHIVMHEWSEDIESLSREEFRIREKEANEFASAFLLPEKEFLSDLRRRSISITNFTSLKSKWKVSISAMLMRAYNLKEIAYHQYQYMMKTMQSKGYKTHEPLDDKLITAPPTLLRYAIDLLLEENVFTESEFLDEISKNGMLMNSDEVERLLNLEPGKLTPTKRGNVLKLRVRNETGGEQEKNMFYGDKHYQN